MQLTPENLSAHIAEAFADMPSNAGVSMQEAEVLDCYGSLEEQREARLKDTTNRWQDVPNEWLAEWPSAWYFLDKEGFLYYLPAGMIWSLNTDDRDSTVPESIFATLCKHGRHWCRPSLTGAQLNVILDWVQYQFEGREEVVKLQYYLAHGRSENALITPPPDTSLRPPKTKPA